MKAVLEEEKVATRGDTKEEEKVAKRGDTKEEEKVAKRGDNKEHGGGAESEPQTITINTETFNKLLTRIDKMEKNNLLMEQKILLLEQQKRDKDNKILRLEKAY